MCTVMDTMVWYASASFVLCILSVTAIYITLLYSIEYSGTYLLHAYTYMHDIH